MSFELTDVSLAQGSDTVIVNNVGIDLSELGDGYILGITGAGKPYAIKSTTVSTIVLNTIYTGLALQNVTATAWSSKSPLITAISKLTEIGNRTVTLNENINKLYDSPNEVEEWTDRNGNTKSFFTYQKLHNIINEAANAIDGLRSNTLRNFEQARKANKLQYGCSGFLSVDKSLNDVNLGISTPRTTPNAFTLGKTELLIDGVLINIPQINVVQPPRPDGLDKLDGSGRYNDIAAAIIAGTNTLNQSSINRQCITVIRSKAIDITTKVYPLGFMQYQSGYADDIGLVDNDTQAECKMFNDNWANDSITLGKVFDWSNLSVNEKDLVMNNPENNIRSNTEAGSLLQTVYQVFNYQTSATYDRLTSTSEIMLAEGFTPVGGDSGLFTKDGWNITPLTITDTLTQSLFHQVYCYTGTKKTDDDKFWFDTVTSFTSIADCFNPSKLLQASGYIGSGSSYFESRHYDEIHADQIRDLRMDVSGKFNIATANEYAEKVSVNGKASSRSVEFTTFTMLISGVLLGNYDASGYTDGIKVLGGNLVAFTFINGGTYDGITDQLVAGDILESNGSTAQIYNIINTSTMFINLIGSISDFTYPNTFNLIKVKVSNTPSAFATDIIATPSVLASTFPNGVYARWIPKLPTGNGRQFSLQRKCLDVDLNKLFTNDDGLTWNSSVASFDSVGNFFSTNQVASALSLLSYKFSPNFTKPSIQKRVDYTSNMVTALNYNQYTEQGICSSLINKIATGNTSPAITSINLSQIGSLQAHNGLYNVGSDYTPINMPLSLANVDSPAVKYFIYAHIPDTGVVEFYAVYKELVFDSDIAGNFTLITSINSDDNAVVGNIYRTDHTINGALSSGAFICLKAFSASWSDAAAWREGADGVMYYGDNTTAYLQRISPNGFGDDNKFIIRDDDNYTTDENANAIKYGCHKISLGYDIYIPQTIANQESV